MPFADDYTIPLPAMYIDTVDPAVTYTDGRVKAGRLWLDTSTGAIGTLKKRNPANDGWNTLVDFDAPAVANDSVTNAKLANMATQTIKGRTTAGTGDPEDLTATQATAILNAVVGDSGSGGTKGLVPAPGAGDAAAGKFLKADGTFDTPPTGGAPSGSAGGDLTGTYPNPTLADDVVDAAALAPADINAQTGTTYTIQASDNNKVITCDNGSAITVTLPSALGSGFNCMIIQKGAGQVTISPSSTTMNNRQSHTKTAGQYAAVSLVAIAANVFILGGDTAS